MKPAVRQLLFGAGGPSLRNYSNSNPLYVAHRGNSILAPEDTLFAYEDALGRGCVAIEQDVHLLSDGGMGVMHDTTVDRTTTGTGLVSSFSSSTFQALAIDAATQNIPGWGDAVSPPLFPAVLAAYRGRAIFVPEIKVTGAKQSVVDALLSANIRKDQALIQSFTLADLAPAVTAGYPALLLLSVASAALAANVTAAQAAGVTWCAIDDTAPDSSFTMWVNAGFKVIAYTVNRRARRDQLLALGVVGFFSDNAPYLNGARSASSQYSTGKWSPGMLSMNTSNTDQNRGTISADGWFGWNNAAFIADGFRGTLQGFLGAMNSPSYTISFEARINSVNAADATRWGSIFISDATMGDNLFTDTNNAAQLGYQCLFRKSGTIDIYATGSGVTTQIATNVNAGMAMADGVTNYFKVTVSPTNIRFSRTDSSGTELQQCNANNTTYRGGYVHFGKNASLTQFRNVTVS